MLETINVLLNFNWKIAWKPVTITTPDLFFWHGSFTELQKLEVLVFSRGAPRKRAARSLRCCFGTPLKTWLARDLSKLKVSAQIKYDSPVCCDYFSSAELSVISSHSLWLLESCSPHCLPTLGQSLDKTRKVSFSSLVMPLLLVISLSALLSPPDNKFDFHLSSPGVPWNAKTLSQKG